MTKTVRYDHTNSYEILNPITVQTRCIWICFHGMGYLATYFKRYFMGINSTEHSFVVLQAPSKFYQNTEFKHVGASWLTRVDTHQEMQNINNYIDAVLTGEDLINDHRLVFMGYSQGVSIACRLAARYPYQFKALIMHSGSIPDEITEEAATHFFTHGDRFIHISGLQDEYATPEIVKRENSKIEKIFGTKCERHTPDIKHEVAVSLLEQIAKTL